MLPLVRPTQDPHHHVKAPQQHPQPENNNMDFSLFNQTDYDYNYTDFDYDVVAPCTYQNHLSVQPLMGWLVYSIICILGFLGNSLVIVNYAFYKRTKSMTDVYLLNVAIADLLFVVSLPLIVYNEMWSWSMGPVACKLLRGSYSVNLYSGMLLLACISIDRYLAIVQARRSFRLRTLPHSRLICAIVWIFAFLLSVPTFYFYNWYDPMQSLESFMLEGHERNLTTRSPQFVCEFGFMNESTAWMTKVAVPSTQLALGFFLPLLIMNICYTAIIMKLLSVRNFQRHKAFWVLLVVVVVFVACQLPHNIVLNYDQTIMFQLETCEGYKALQAAKTIMQTVAYLHCCLSPVLYAFGRSEVQEPLQKDHPGPGPLLQGHV
ncbi:C-C chemokine receptor type 6-like [Platichthys flesus]|uniref:C-C chemokine receptor type 6-like n=1 Tax=Platichthys flesus TaxID=8260 RepID=UPI002DBC3DFF|nr:C-C chemokine receptor type 6-like [Platichthys flesus]